MFKRFRDWLRPWNWSTRRWIVALVVALIATPLMTRWYCLWQVPDVALPFDVEQFLAYEDVTPDEDAFLVYAKAAAVLSGTGSAWSSQGTRTEDVAAAIDKALDEDGTWDPLLDQWLTDNAKALEYYEQGGTKPKAKGPSLRTADFMSLLRIHNEVRWLARLARLEAKRCEKAGDIEAAWKWHKANLQCARHSEMPNIDIPRLIGAAVRGTAILGIADWAQSPMVTAEQLRVARLEVLAEAVRRTPLSDCSKGEYLMTRNSLRRADFINEFLPAFNRGFAAHPVWLPVKRAWLWTTGQPDVVFRLQRQLLVNNQGLIDLPLHQRPKTVDCKVAVVFDLPANSKRMPGQMEPRELAAALDASLLRLGQFIPSVSSPKPVHAIEREDALLSALVVLLACQEYHRNQGQFPAQVEDLVPDYLDQVPSDPTATSSVPVQYRRDPDGQIVVWCVDINRVDDDGDVIPRGQVAKDIGLRTHKSVEPVTN